MRGPFRNQAFRRLFAGRVLTNIGDSVYFIAAMWLVYDLTANPLYTGIAGFLTMAPSALQFLAGPIVDRWSIRHILAGTQAIQAVVVLLVPVAYYLDALTVGVVLVVMPTLSALNQLVYPAQIAALPRLLEDEKLVAANSAFALAKQGLDMVANGVSGVLIGIVGAVTLFVLDAVTFAIAALLFATVAIPQAEPSTAAQAGNETDDPVQSADESPVVADGGQDEGKSLSYSARLRAGGRFLRGTFLVPLLGGAAIVNATAGMVLAALPAYADSLAGGAVAIGDAGAYGVLMAAFAGGNFFGALSANVIDDWRLGRTLIGAFLATGSLWTVAVAVEWLPLTAVLMGLAFIPVGAVNVQIAAVVQAAPPDHFVGRVSSLLGSVTAASIPVGSLAGGIVAATYSPSAALLFLGIAAIGYGAYVVVHPTLRSLPTIHEIQLR